MPHFLTGVRGRHPMASQAEVVRNRTIGGEEPLRVPGRFEALHTSFPLAGGLVRMFRVVIQGPMLAVLHAGQGLSPRRLVALEFIGDEHPRYIPQSREEFAREPFGRKFIATAPRRDPVTARRALARSDIASPGADGPASAGIRLSPVADPVDRSAPAWNVKRATSSLLVMEASKPMFLQLIAAEPMTSEFMSSEPIVAEPMTSESMSPEPMSSTPCMPLPRACQEQHRQHDDDAHPLLPGSHKPSLPCITMSAPYET